MKSRYYIEIDTGGEEASGYEDRLPWVSYGTIVAEGDTLEELLDTATVDLIDQDGGERGFVEADSDLFQGWVREAFREKYLDPASPHYDPPGAPALSDRESADSDLSAVRDSEAGSLNRKDP